MKKLILLFILLGVAFVTPAQEKKRDRIKRKFQQTEEVTSELPPVLVHGRVFNADREILAGASVVVRGTRIGVNTNGEGEYYLKGLPTGAVSIQASYVGYKTKIIDY